MFGPKKSTALIEFENRFKEEREKILFLHKKLNCKCSDAQLMEYNENAENYNFELTKAGHAPGQKFIIMTRKKMEDNPMYWVNP